MEDVSFELAQISEVASIVWKENHQHKIWAFHGLMGAGKTTLINALCKLLNATGNISSPTFSIINEYDSNVAGTIYHMDWYRLSGEEEIINAGCEDCLESGRYCFIEWPEKAPGLILSDALHLHLETLERGKRRLRLITAAH